jgi:diguanylate cyclase (GGDEF)-like protein/PAS domain S-box-containing protein
MSPHENVKAISQAPGIVGLKDDCGFGADSSWSQNIGMCLRFFDHLQDGVLVANAQGRILFFSSAAERLFAYRRNMALGRMVTQFVPDASELGPGVQLNGYRKDGSRFPIEGTAVRLEAAEGCCWVYAVRDAAAHQGRGASDQLAALVYQNSSEGMLVTDHNGIILDANPAFTKLRGYSAREAVGMHIRTLNSVRHDRDFYRTVWRAVAITGSWQGEHWGQHKNGELYPEWLSINTIFSDDGSAYRRVIIFSNITEIKQAAATIWRQANFDRLTGLPNRQMFHARLEQNIKIAQRKKRKLALMFLDLDRFKEVNDTLGHAVGDILLKQAGQRLHDCVRQTDTVARLGGDEFTVIIDDLQDVSDVERIASLILKKMAEPFQLGLETVFISTSIGVTFYPDDSTNTDTLLNNADQAMYVAKSLGRNRYSFFMPSMQEAAQTRMRLANDLHLALRSKQFSLVYQPIVDLATGEIYKAEALLRWRHPIHGQVPPAQFIPLAEETGIISAIGEWVFQQASRQALHWRSIYNQRFQISVNASPVQFRHDGIKLENWLGHLRELGMAGQGVAIEITEGMLLDGGDGVADQLLALRQAGIQVSLDDFGTGYSSLSYLHRFDIDYLKIDRSFVQNLEISPQNKALCEAIIVMAHKLGLKVVAEGVESTKQRDLLIAAGCDYAQGYLFSRPVAAKEFEALLQPAIS